MKFKQWWNTVLEYVYPPRCIFCSKVVPPGQQCCSGCFENVVPVFWHSRMMQSQTGKTFYCIAPDVYESQIRKAMLAFKFRGKQKHAKFFARRILEQLKQEQLLGEVDVITSVPLSPNRKKQRGYNQSELIARELAFLTQIPYSTVLEKTVENHEQHKLHSRERRKNVEGVYQPLPMAEIKGRHFLLVDDIMTTGSTLDECAGVLFQEEATLVLCAAAARVLLEDVSC
ncbi:ComF family protein [Clostridium minihomine]|uniref:ComF family protein n=1 Tax=Clostridium minihomine TaxID=2045012 RepID=UPI000C7636D1|nr:ComF family protein [Clostridium minihomine]